MKKKGQRMVSDTWKKAPALYVQPCVSQGYLKGTLLPNLLTPCLQHAESGELVSATHL